MRWLKHLTLASDDSDMVELLDEHGAEGYGIWWLILERIARGMDKDSINTSARLLPSRWAKLCATSIKKFQKVTNFLQVRGKLTLTMDGDYLLIDCPKILKYRDEYSRKVRSDSGQTPEKGGSLSGQTPDENRSEQNRTDKDLKPGPVDNSGNGTDSTGANAGGLVLRAHPPAAPIEWHAIKRPVVDLAIEGIRKGDIKTHEVLVAFLKNRGFESQDVNRFSRAYLEDRGPPDNPR